MRCLADIQTLLWTAGSNVPPLVAMVAVTAEINKDKLTPVPLEQPRQCTFNKVWCAASVCCIAVE